ncbi:MAG: hypothetical protein ACI9VS_002236, partial [Candidatus Binatia bacterium]
NDVGIFTQYSSPSNADQAAKHARNLREGLTIFVDGTINPNRLTQSRGRSRNPVINPPQPMLFADRAADLRFIADFVHVSFRE